MFFRTDILWENKQLHAVMRAGFFNSEAVNDPQMAVTNGFFWTSLFVGILTTSTTLGN